MQTHKSRGCNHPTPSLLQVLPMTEPTRKQLARPHGSLFQHRVRSTGGSTGLSRLLGSEPGWTLEAQGRLSLQAP